MRKDYTFIVTYRTIVSTAAAELVMWVTDWQGNDGHWIAFGPSAFTTTTWAATDATPADNRFTGDLLIHSMQWTRTSANSAIPGALWTRISFISAITESSNHDCYRSVEWYTDSNAQGSWPDAATRTPLANGENGVPKRIWVFQGTVVNGAGGAGNQTLTATAGTGSRFRVLFGQIVNGDTVARAAVVTITDGTNNLTVPGFNGALGAGNILFIPSTGTTDASATAPNGVLGPYWIAGTMTIELRNTAVAASQDSAFALVCEVEGAIPNPQLAGASTPVLTVNTNAFMGG